MSIRQKLILGLAGISLLVAVVGVFAVVNNGSTIAALLLATFLGFYISRSISNPIRNLQGTAMEFGRGNLHSRIAISTRDEVGKLAVALNEMAESLQKTTVSKTDLEAKIEERTAELAQANEILESDIITRNRAEVERQVIAEIVQSVVTTANLDELFKLAHDAVKKILPAESCFIALHNTATDELNFEYWVDLFDPAPLPRPLGKSFSSYMQRTGKPLMLTKEYKNQMYEDGEVEKSGTDSLSWLGVPLKTRSRTLGVLIVQDYEQQHAYSQRDLEFLSAVGDQLGLAIERKRIEIELKTNEMELTAAQRIAHIGSWEWDISKKNLRWSEELFRIFGLEPRDSGPSVAEFFAYVLPEDLKLVQGAIKRALKHGVVPSFDFRILREDKTVRVLQMNGEVDTNETLRLTRLWGTIQDITDRMQVENAFRQSEEKNRELIENANDIIYTIDLSGRFTSLNKAGELITGYSLNEALQMNIADVINSEDAERVRQRIAENLSSGSVPSFELEIFAKHGGSVTMDINSRLIHNNGAVVGIQGIGRDITDRKRAERELRARETQLNEAQQIAHIGSWEFDIVTGEIKWSDELWRIFGLDQREFGLTFDEYLATVHPDDRQVVKSVDERAHQEKADFDHHYRIVHPDGAMRVIRCIGRVVCNEHGQVVKMTGTDQDVTEQKQIEDDLEQARDAALESTRLKSEFLANMSHEIRTPMNGVIGMTELALDTSLTTDQREYLDMVKESADSLLVIINDILDFSKIEAGKIELDNIDFELSEVIGEMLRPLAMRADQKGLELTLHVVPGVPESLKGDPQRLRQILVNLVGNAIKFTSNGEVSVLVEKQSQNGDEVYLHIQVRDTGIGVPLEKQSIIFGAFAQADGSTTRTYGGTGLGLAISSQLVELMGGRMWVESPAASSEKNKISPGCVMHFTICLSIASIVTNRRVVDLDALQNLKVLVVDDNATNGRILQETLEHWKMKPMVVASGSAGLIEMKRAVEMQEPYRLVLLDAQMPEMDGFAVVERIKETPEFAGAAVMMLSSGDQNSQVARCRKLGLELYLVKPVRRSELLAAIGTVLGAILPETNEIERLIEPALYSGTTGLHVLLVEDNLINQRFALSLLEKRGHLVEIANNGREAIIAFAAKPFDIVLMDVQMPTMNGFEATGLIREREQPRGTHTPIIAMTAHALKGDRERCLAAGMDAYLSKPIKADELMRTIDHLVSTSNAIAADITAVDGQQDGDDVDSSMLLARTDGDVELAAELAEIFLEQWPHLLTAMREAIAHNDSVALERAVHTTRGSIGYFSNASAELAALRLQQMSTQNDLREANTTLDDLGASIELLNAELRGFIRAAAN